MSRFLRLFCVWLIAIAIPLQGMAAATMPGCGAASKQRHGDGGHAMHAVHAEDAATGDGPATMHAAGHHPAAAEAAPPTGSHDSHGKTGCPVCAACCLGNGLTAPALQLPAPLPRLVAILAAATLQPASTSLAGLERPPRPRLA